MNVQDLQSTFEKRNYVALRRRELKPPPWEAGCWKEETPWAGEEKQPH